MSAFSGNRKKFHKAFNDNSKLVFIEHIEFDTDLVALSSSNKVVLFNTNQINGVESRATKGVHAIKLKCNSKMILLKNS